MNLNPSGAGPFRAQMSAGKPAGDAVPTERITLRPPGAQRDIKVRAEASSRGQRTRRTVDLPAATHRALDIWQREAADRLGVARVTGQEVLTALIDQLLVDPNLGAQIVRNIQERRR